VVFKNLSLACRGRVFRVLESLVESLVNGVRKSGEKEKG